jgi:hypothetical protein
MVTPPQIDASVPLRPSKIQIVLNVDGRLDQSNQHLTAQMRILLRTVVGQARNDRQCMETPYFVDFRDVWLAYNDELLAPTTLRWRTST